MAGGGQSPARPRWDVQHLPRSEALNILHGAAPGTFVVRASDKTAAALSMVKQDGTQYHMHIERSGAGFFLRKCQRCFPNLPSLVAYYASPQQNDLPTALRLT